MLLFRFSSKSRFETDRAKVTGKVVVFTTPIYALPPSVFTPPISRLLISIKKGTDRTRTFFLGFIDIFLTRLDFQNLPER
jgi:hypothetical protein